MTATPLQPFMAMSELLLNVHKNDAIFTVVKHGGRYGLLLAVPSAFLGVRWVGTRTVQSAFESSGAMLTGVEAYNAVFTDSHLPTVLLYRSIDGLSLYGSLT